MKNAANDHIETLVSYLIEAHMHEFEDNHGGDADHPGEAPEACSYCLAIDEAREFLAAEGEDVCAITPGEETPQ